MQYSHDITGKLNCCYFLFGYWCCFLAGYIHSVFTDAYFIAGAAATAAVSAAVTISSCATSAIFSTISTKFLLLPFKKSLLNS